MPRILCAAVLCAVVLVGCGGGSPATPLGKGRDVYASTCSACHGSRGQGGTGPSLHDVISTFPSCADHIEWVALGSDAWLTEHGGTRGATNRPIEGGMPSHATMSPEAIALVAAFERVSYGGEDEATALADCGVNEG